MTALALGLEISAAIAILLFIVAFSYRQVCIAYPNGGGSYSVSKRNLGRTISLVAASALMIDYVMTVAVSTTSAVEQITSAVPSLSDGRVEIGVAAIGIIAIGNLRGIREAGNIFALPTYRFVGSALLMIALGTVRIVVFGDHGSFSQAAVDQAVAQSGGTIQNVGIILLLRAFAGGAVALTATEAIATGVPAFQPPEPRNAATTLTAMATLLGVLFIGITFLAVNFGITAIDVPVNQTVVSQVARAVYGDGTIGFLAFQAFTALILFLAANTSYNAFPRLLAILPGDGHAPRQFALRGDRLAFSYGIVILSLIAATLIVVFHGETHLLIPMYAVGVFIDFTISQAGMIRHWLRERPAGWRRRLVINATGCLLTATVAVVVIYAKAPTSLLVLAIVPLLVLLMVAIWRQYEGQAAELRVADDLVFRGPHRRQRAIVPVNGLNRAVVQAVNFARTTTSDVRGVYVTEDRDEGESLRRRWERQLPGVPLVIVESPYRAVVEPIVAYLDVLDLQLEAAAEAPVTVVVLPEYVAKQWWDRVLYNQTAKRLKAALVGRDHTVIADVPYRREH